MVMIVIEKSSFWRAFKSFQKMGSVDGDGWAIIIGSYLIKVIKCEDYILRRKSIEW